MTSAFLLGFVLEPAPTGFARFIENVTQIDFRLHHHDWVFLELENVYRPDGAELAANSAANCDGWERTVSATILCRR